MRPEHMNLILLPLRLVVRGCERFRALTCAGSRAVQDQLLRVVVRVCMHVVHVDQTGESLLDCDCQCKRHFELTVPVDPVRIFTLNPWPIDSLGTLDGRTL